MATHSSTLAWKISWTEELGAGYCPWGHKESGTTERLHFSSLRLLHIYSFPSQNLSNSRNNDRGFPCGSAGKESICNVRDLGSIPGLGRFPGEGNDYPLPYSHLENSMNSTVKQQYWAYLVAQLVKNPTAMQETPV